MQRRWRVPPPPEWGFEAPDGAAVLDENVAGLGVLLWDVTRDVVLWATASPRELTEIFPPAQERMRTAWLMTTMLDPKLESALLGLVRIPGQPSLASRERTSLACHSIAQWADERGAVATAYAFMHAAAFACPGNARLSYEAGRLARRRAEYARAEDWLKRAVLLGRQVGDWDSCINGRGGLGNMYIQRGNYPRAGRHHRRALVLARRQGLRDLEGQALHSLCVVAIHTGQISEVNRWARQAREVFGPGDARLPILAHDVGCAWMEQGLFPQALQVFEATRRHWRPADVLLGHANICRAAAGTGVLERYEQAWLEASSLITDETHENTAQALLDLAHAATTVGELERAEMVAQRACRVAAERRESRIRLAAEAVLEFIGRDRSAIHRLITRLEPDVVEDTNAIAEDFADCLGSCAGAGV